MEVKEERYLLTEAELAERLPITASTLRNHRHMGTGLPYVKFGRNIFYDWRVVLRYLDENIIDPSR
jgi:hypothetical protein